MNIMHSSTKKHLSEEHRKKIGEANRKRILSNATKLKISLAHKGLRLGRKHSEETILKMKKKRRFQIFSEETKLKISKSAKQRINDLNSNWKGGITPIGLRIRVCNKYLEWRQQVFLRDNFTCLECGDACGGNLEAHHEKRFSVLLAEIRRNLPLIDLYSAALLYAPMWDINNGKTLCEKCHKKLGGGKC